MLCQTCLTFFLLFLFFRLDYYINNILCPIIGCLQSDFSFIAGDGSNVLPQSGQAHYYGACQSCLTSLLLIKALFLGYSENQFSWIIMTILNHFYNIF